MEYERPNQKRRFPKKRSAAVAIMSAPYPHLSPLTDARGSRIFIGRLGDLYVLLSTQVPF